MVDTNDRDDLAAIKHRAVIRGGEIHHNNTPNHPIIFINNHGHLNLTGNLPSANTFNSNTINSDVNKFITRRPNVALGGRTTAGQTLVTGTRRTPLLPPMRPWKVFLDVGGAAD